MLSQSHYDYALFALRAAYMASHVATTGKAQEVVRNAIRHTGGGYLSEQAIVALTARCHAALTREGALERDSIGSGFVRKVA